MKLAIVALVVACHHDGGYLPDRTIATRVAALAAKPAGGPALDEHASRDALVAWAKHRGTLAFAGDPAQATMNVWTNVEQIFKQSDDDDTLDAVVYFATQLRANGTGLPAAMMAAQLETELSSLRAAKPEWRFSRVRDDDFERLLVSEYEYTAPGVLRDERYRDGFGAGILAAHDAAIANHLTAAPPEWYAIEIAVDVALRGGEVDQLDSYVAKWVSARDAYNKWLDR